MPDPFHDDEQIDALDTAHRLIVAAIGLLLVASLAMFIIAWCKITGQG